METLSKLTKIVKWWKKTQFSKLKKLISPLIVNKFLKFLLKDEVKRYINTWELLKLKKKIPWCKYGGSMKNLLPSSQAALARVQNVWSRHGIRQNLCETCTFLMVPCWVWCNHYRGRYRQSRLVQKYRLHPVFSNNFQTHYSTDLQCTWRVTA